MKHDELLIHLMVLKPEETVETRAVKLNNAIRAVVELHRPAWASDGDMCLTCSKILSVTSFEMTVQQAKYPCTTIQAIEKELA